MMNREEERGTEQSHKLLSTMIELRVAPLQSVSSCMLESPFDPIIIRADRLRSCNGEKEHRL